MSNLHRLIILFVLFTLVILTINIMVDSTISIYRKIDDIAF